MVGEDEVASLEEAEGIGVGDTVGPGVGANVGSPGPGVGRYDGTFVGAPVGRDVCSATVGALVGGATVGALEGGAAVGTDVGTVGAKLPVGAEVRTEVGFATTLQVAAKDKNNILQMRMTALEHLRCANADSRT